MPEHQAGNPPTAGAPPTQIVLQPTGRRRLLSRLGWIGFLVCAGLLMSQFIARREYFDRSHGVQERYVSGARYGTDKVAVITVSGVIASGEGFAKSQIDRVREDEHVKAVVLRVNSPGGTVTGSDYLYHHLTRLCAERELPLVVSMGDIAASGGYYISMAVGEQKDAIFAEPTSITGSIGVIIPHYDFSGLLQRWDVENNAIVSHPRKQMLSPTRTMPEDHRQLLQAQVDSSFERFKSIVHAGRPTLRGTNGEQLTLMSAAGRDLATGEVFTAQQAAELGLVDRIGFLEDAVERAIELAGLGADTTRVVRYRRPASLLDLAGVPVARAETPDWARLMEFATPKAYYLATTLPVLLSAAE